MLVMSRRQLHEGLAKITVVPVSSTDRLARRGRFTAGEAGSASPASPSALEHNSLKVRLARVEG